MYIGVGGQLQFGKDTTADYLNIQLNAKIGTPHWKRSAFAYNVKRIFMETFGKDMDYVETWKVLNDTIPPDLDMSVRKALQFIGDGFRKIKSSIWIDLIFRDKAPQIISDCRYINELKAVNDHGGFNILVINPAKLNNDPNGSEAEIRPLVVWAIEHQWSLENQPLLEMVRPFPGEYGAPHGIQYVDYILFNTGTIEELYAKIDKFIVPKVLAHFKE